MDVSATKAIVVYLSTRDRDPGPQAITIINEYLRQPRRWTLSRFLFYSIMENISHASPRIRQLAHSVLQQWHPQWKSRLERRRSKSKYGLSAAQLKVWVSILTPSTWDERAKRFLGTESALPLCLFLLLLHKHSKLHDIENLNGLMQHFRDFYCLARSPSITPSLWLFAFSRLAEHCRRLDPATLVQLSEIAVDYMENALEDKNGKQKELFALRTRLLDSLLDEFSMPCHEATLRSRRFQWKAQRVLLEMSQGSFEKPLLLGEAGFRAIRKVLLGLPKNRAEVNIGAKAADTWPPYRRPQDGMDEVIPPENMVSRAAAAGISKRGSGYDDTPYDKALDILAGGAPGNLPTVQTRSLPPPSGPRRAVVSSKNIQTGTRAVRSIMKYRHLRRHHRSCILEWASKIRSTRNATEAWAIFQTPPSPNIEPTAEIYTQMFHKIVAVNAKDLDFSIDLLPGDHAHIVFHPNNTNISEYELARTMPPSALALYEKMIRDGVVPNESLLYFLVAYVADSFDTACDILMSNPSAKVVETGKFLRRAIIKARSHSIFATGDSLSMAYFKDVHGMNQVSKPLFLALVKLACRLQASYHQTPGGPTSQAAIVPMQYLRVAIHLIRLKMGFSRIGTETTRIGWYYILRALSRSEVFVTTDRMPWKTIASLQLLTRMYCIRTEGHWVDPKSFVFLCKGVENTAFAMLRGKNSMYAARHVVWRAFRTLWWSFQRLTPSWWKNDQARRPSKTNTGYGTVRVNALHHYMRTLGLFGGQEVLMARILLKALIHIDSIMGDHSSFLRWEVSFMSVLCAFRAFAERPLRGTGDRHLASMLAEIKRLVLQIDGLDWPNEAKMKEYLNQPGYREVNWARIGHGQIRASTSWWHGAVQVSPEEDLRHRRKYWSLGHAIADVTYWKCKIREDAENRYAQKTQCWHYASNGNDLVQTGPAALGD